MCSGCQARENIFAGVAYGFGFTSDRLRKWWENFKSIDKRCKVEQKKVRITSNTLVKEKTLYLHLLYYDSTSDTHDNVEGIRSLHTVSKLTVFHLFAGFYN